MGGFFSVGFMLCYSLTGYNPPTMYLTFADLFAGIGGIRLGMEQACSDLKVDCKCVYSCEINQWACKTYQKNFGDDPTGDITSVSKFPTVLPDFDICLAGFPCQAFSQAGIQEGFDDIRGTLFFDLAKIIKAKRPVAFLLENVENLPRHEGGRTFKIILDVLERRLGYGLHYKVINSRDFGVPQNRPRIYIVGFDKEKGVGGGFKFPDPPKDLRLVTFGDVEEEEMVDAKYYINQKYFDWLKRHREHHQKKGGQFGYIVIPKDSYAKAVICGGMGKERNLVKDERRTDFSERPRVNDEFIRLMTPKEWERLQGYEDNWTEGVSDTQRWKQLGNSVTVPVVHAFAKSMVECLMNPKPYKGKWDGGTLFT